jgi:hypothetical protein
MLIFLLFVVLLALKLAAICLVSYFGPIASLIVIAACIAIAYRWEAGAAGANNIGSRLD